MTSSCRICVLSLFSFLLEGCSLLGPVPQSRPESTLAPEGDDTFSLVILPDTQKYVETESDFGLFTAQTHWIALHKEELNIAFVLHAGDIVENSDRDLEWRRAGRALSILDNKVPYILAVGNHDLEGPATFDKTRATRAYNHYFPASKFQAQPWYGGSQRAGENDNYYTLFEHKNLKFLIISLEFAPPNEVLQWANQVAAAHPDRRIVVLTHCYLDTLNERATHVGLINPHNFNLPQVNDGEHLWTRFVSRHKNIFLVVSGHYHGVGRLTSVGVHGNKVHQVLANYQSRRFYGRYGWLRIMQFFPRTDTIAVKTFSPYLNEWLTDGENEFVLRYDMRDPGQQPRHAEVSRPPAAAIGEARLGS